MEAVSCEGAGLSTWKSEELSKSDRPDLASAGYFCPLSLTHTLSQTHTCALKLSHAHKHAQTNSLTHISLTHCLFLLLSLSLSSFFSVFLCLSLTRRLWRSEKHRTSDVAGASSIYLCVFNCETTFFWLHDSMVVGHVIVPIHTCGMLLNDLCHVTSR